MNILFPALFFKMHFCSRSFWNSGSQLLGASLAAMRRNRRQSGPSVQQSFWAVTEALIMKQKIQSHQPQGKPVTDEVTMSTGQKSNSNANGNPSFYSHSKYYVCARYLLYMVGNYSCNMVIQQNTLALNVASFNSPTSPCLLCMWSYLLQNMHWEIM